MNSKKYKNKHIWVRVFQRLFTDDVIRFFNILITLLTCITTRDLESYGSMGDRSVQIVN